MLTLIIVHVAKKLSRFGKDVSETWREAQRLRRRLLARPRSSYTPGVALAGVGGVATC
jgi:hypothetical protein